MKPSKYNYIVPFGEKHVFFNGITQAFFMVSNDHKENFQLTVDGDRDTNNSVKVLGKASAFCRG